MDLELNDKVAVVSGGSIGIGLAIAKGLASKKAKVVICARDEKRIQEESERIQDQFEVEMLGVSCDAAIKIL